MAAWGHLARSLGLRANNKGAELFLHQTRKMAGGGPIGYMEHSRGKAIPADLQGPEFITYAGLTISKPVKDFEHYWTKAVGGLVWFTMLYHFSLNWEEHWYGDIWVFERDVQMNGWDDEHGEHAHHH